MEKEVAPTHIQINSLEYTFRASLLSWWMYKFSLKFAKFKGIRLNWLWTKASLFLMNILSN